MKTSCSSWSHHRTIAAKQMDQMSWLKECASMKLDGVELLSNHFPSTEKDYLVRLKKACTDLYLDVAVVSGPGHLTTSDDAKRAAEVATIEKWIEVGQFMGSQVVRFFCGRGAELEAGGKELYSKVVESLHKIMAKAAQYGITMAMENHGGTTADQLLSLVKDVGSEYFKFTLDTGNFPPASKVGPATYTSIERCAPLAAIVHAKFFNVQADGTDADFDWKKIHGLLAGAGFRGFLSIEYEGPSDDEVGSVRRAAKYLNTLR